MAWTAPITATLNGAFTAAQFNATIRDNLAETFPGKATTAGRWFTSTAANTLAQREISTAEISTEQSTTSTSFVDLGTVGPAITVTTGTFAIVSISCTTQTDINAATNSMSFAVSGATTIAASDAWAVIQDGPNGTSANRTILGASYGVTLTAGSNTFTAKYRASSGSEATFVNRHMTVWSF